MICGIRILKIKSSRTGPKALEPINCLLATRCVEEGKRVEGKKRQNNNFYITQLLFRMEIKTIFLSYLIFLYYTKCL